MDGHGTDAGAVNVNTRVSELKFIRFSSRGKARRPNISGRKKLRIWVSFVVADKNDEGVEGEESFWLEDMQKSSRGRSILEKLYYPIISGHWITCGRSESVRTPTRLNRMNMSDSFSLISCTFEKLRMIYIWHAVSVEGNCNQDGEVDVYNTNVDHSNSETFGRELSSQEIQVVRSNEIGLNYLIRPLLKGLVKTPIKLQGLKLTNDGVAPRRRKSCEVIYRWFSRKVLCRSVGGYEALEMRLVANRKAALVEALRMIFTIMFRSEEAEMKAFSIAHRRYPARNPLPLTICLLGDAEMMGRVTNWIVHCSKYAEVTKYKKLQYIENVTRTWKLRQVVPFLNVYVSLSTLVGIGEEASY